jgi:ureidoglycolate dehydrogenase (NAD+)
MAYHGAAAPSLATSPLAIGVPAADGPLILDMATSMASMGRLLALAERGGTLEAGVALDAEGRPTLDAALAVTPLSLAGAKGSGLSFMIECLTSLLAGHVIVAPVLHGRSKRRQVQNAFLLAIHIDTFRARAGFMADVDDFVAALKGLPRLDGVAEIRAPGERGRATAKRQAVDGVPLSAGTRRLLYEAAAARGIAVPFS